jgi:cytochrome b6-f complex iron-sulfur subunit
MAKRAHYFENVPELKPGEARAFSFVDEKPGLLFRARNGELGAVNAVCTHLGCTVEWIEGAQLKAAFRCPCHESQFTPTAKRSAAPRKSRFQGSRRAI